ncbi:hypothetical protein K490DRAFT_58632 [Saccharata proteae CBS 121410]|uniref:Uncharacterized protein n=1 Tax=Saccharata proteae CBS 121410 TaxID=1314787 RepID=A0A9P4LTE8_9PEZI|nr:hypothetical protein K490DRAFT_58632 [Saccharata proteae CBS 121410]
MDDAASTTLLTFRLDSPQHVRSIELLGSWDNFTHPYRLDRDPRRGTEHWAGCFRFKDIICDGFQQATPSKRQGGLMMGGTYWYYYKLDDSLEYHDPTKPWTTACPLLPGQNLNVIEVPHETPSTKDDLDTTPCPILTPAFTLDPHSRFTTPRPNKFEAICRKPLPTLPGPLELQVTRDSWKSAHSPVSPPVADTERPFSSNSRHSLSESLRSWKAFSFLRKARRPAKRLRHWFAWPNGAQGKHSISGAHVACLCATAFDVARYPFDPIAQNGSMGRYWGSRFRLWKPLWPIRPRTLSQDCQIKTRMRRLMLLSTGHPRKLRKALRKVICAR